MYSEIKHKERIDSLLLDIDAKIKADTSSVLKKLLSIRRLSESRNYRLNEVLYKISKCYNMLNVLDKAQFYILKSLELQNENKDPAAYAEALSHYGSIMNTLGLYEKAAEALSKAIKVQKNISDKVPLIYSYMRIGNTYGSYLKDNAKSFTYYNKALKHSVRIKNNYLMSLCLGCLGNAYLYKTDFRKSKYYYLRAVEILEELNNKSDLCRVLLGLGTALRKLGEYKESINVLTRGMMILKRGGNKNLRNSMIINLSISSLLAGDMKRFDLYYNKSINLIESGNDKALSFNLYEALSEVYEGRGDYKSAFIHFKKFFEIYSQIFKEESERVHKILRLKYEKEKSERETEIYRLKAQELTREIEAKTKELNAMASYLSQKNEFVKNLVTNVKKDFLDFKVEEKIGEYLDSAVRKAESASNLNEDLKRFEIELDKFSISFIEMLSKKFPTLSRVELKICSMMKINLSSKEIANLLFLSRRTVENHKYRIYKKINLRPNQNIITFLNSF